MGGSRALSFLLVAVAACDCGGTADPTPAPAAGRSSESERGAEPALRGAPLGSDALPTTHGRIYVANLEGRIELLESRARGGSAPLEVHRELATSYRTRFSYGGDLGDLERAAQQIETALELEPEHVENLMLAARIELGLHRFAGARAFLDRAATAGADSVSLRPIRQELDWAAGDSRAAMTSIRADAEQSPRVQSLARLAVLEHQLGDTDASERAFESAESAVRDTDPYRVAWLNLQRGHACLDRGELDRAIVFLRESVRRLGDYTDARRHLAQVLLLHDDHGAEARQLYTELAEEGDAEAMGMLSKLLSEAGETASAEGWAGRARAAYTELLERFPAAMASHAASFYVQDGQGDRALELLRDNAELQPNGESFTRLAETELELGRVEAAAGSAERAASAEYAPVRLRPLSVRICREQDVPAARCPLLHSQAD